VGKVSSRFMTPFVVLQEPTPGFSLSYGGFYLFTDFSGVLKIWRGNVIYVPLTSLILPIRCW